MNVETLLNWTEVISVFYQGEPCKAITYGMHHTYWF